MLNIWPGSDEGRRYLAWFVRIGRVPVVEGVIRLAQEAQPEGAQGSGVAELVTRIYEAAIHLDARPEQLPTPLLAGIGAVGVSVLELGTGLACRRLLHVEVWDYSQEWGNLAGLVCPKYTALWFLLCLWVLGMMRFLRGFAAYVARTKA